MSTQFFSVFNGSSDGFYIYQDKPAIVMPDMQQTGSASDVFVYRPGKY